MFSFLPREIEFFDLFEQASENVVEAGQCLKNLMHNFQEPEKQIQHIKDLEHKGDGLTHDLFYKLNKTFITPMDREDIHALASALDDILDEIDAVAELLGCLKLIIQPRLPASCLKFFMNRHKRWGRGLACFAKKIGISKIVRSV